MGRPKMLIVGWDGATFDIINPLLLKGHLPNIASLLRTGVWGRLESTIPPLTPVAWTSISTGVNPGKHGIYDAMLYDNELHKITFVNSTMRKVKPVWKILSERGSKVGVLNVPVTYPPDEVDGFVIPGMFTPEGASDFFYPQQLQEEIENRFGKYIIECRKDNDPSAYLKSILEMVDLRERVSLYLMDRHPLDFFFVAFVASDRAQHFYWKYLDTSHPEHSRYKDAIPSVYKRLDQALGSLLKKVGPDTNVIMVSDHGAGPLNSAFFLNNWLLKKGYLRLKEDPAIALKARGNSKLKSLVSKSIKKIVPSRILSKIRHYGVDEGQKELNRFCSLIDWDKTMAFSEGAGGGIYINCDAVGEERYKDLVAELTEELYNVVDQGGKKVVKMVYRRDELYRGDHVKYAPDLTILCDAGYQVIAPNELLYFNKNYDDALFLPHRWSARHEKHGIFVLHGPAVKKNIEINESRVIDIAPTVLYLMNEAIPEYMDGKVLDEAIEKKYITRNPVRHESYVVQQESTGMKLSEEEEKDIAEKLKGLGYIE